MREMIGRTLIQRSVANIKKYRAFSVQAVRVIIIYFKICLNQEIHFSQLRKMRQNGIKHYHMKRFLVQRHFL